MTRAARAARASAVEAGRTALLLFFIGLSIASAVHAIILATSVVPGVILCAGAIPLLFLYDLTEHKLAAARTA